MVSALAESWEVSPDELTYTFAQRDGVTWHDGEPSTSADVKFILDAGRAHWAATRPPGRTSKRSAPSRLPMPAPSESS